MSVAGAVLYGLANLFHPRMLWLMVWPMLVSLAIWGSAALVLWTRLALWLAELLNQWALGGRWKVGDERAVLDAAPGRIVFRFRARDLHLVLGPGADGKPVRFRVLLDGKAPGADHGMDIDAEGQGTVREQRLYQLIRQKGGVQEHEFTVEFLDPHVEAYSFTFG